MYIITSKTRSRMRRDPNSQRQLKEERSNFYKEQGITSIQPLKGQSEEKAFEDIKETGSFVKDALEQNREISRLNREKKNKERKEKLKPTIEKKIQKIVEQKKREKKF